MNRSLVVVLTLWSAVIIACLVSCSATVLDDTALAPDAGSDGAIVDAVVPTDAAIDAAITDGGLACTPPSILCGASCVDPRFDPTHCGSCSTTCASGTVCSSGVCSLTCLGGSTKCGSLCVDTRDDPSNCGACGTSCGADTVCSNGGCYPLGQDGGSPSYCNRAPDLTLCSSSCVDTTTDRSNCGGCGSWCPAAENCVDSQCACPADAGGPTFCSGTCTDTTTDSANCGGCGAACLVHQTCADSKCECSAGFTTCSGVCTDFSIDAKSCGACGTPCAAGSVCTDGVCGAATGTWQMLGSDAQHTGNNPNEVGKPPMTDEWRVSVSVTTSGALALSPAVIENGRVFVSYANYFSPSQPSPLVAYDVTDGTQLWSYNFGPVDNVGFPAVVDGSVYIQSIDESERCFLWSLDLPRFNRHSVYAAFLSLDSNCSGIS